ncbi:MAG: methyltransferase domain-containing protein [Candidatus Binatus sp.]|uniref:class I SAM-dependent methyltransferase n=1 Tax=Candidatus Binatus sp. TaxID=2811406 RepID=UPI00271BCDA2|nr:methyltransferase domain-containing protein [Candidatus Binatus sp.]MDO8434096.1 methyltransferase domain-containing protein [Candidatus Binatus sp.]
MSDTQSDFDRVRGEQREFWNKAAPGWKVMWTSLDSAGQPVSDRLVELARIKPGDRVLDIATGSGEPGITAARKVGASGLVIATDQSPAMLDLARERAAALGLRNIRFVETGAESLDIEERNFDAAICRWGLMFVPGLDAVPRRVAQLLKPGATFATSVWGPPAKVPLISTGDDEVRALTNLPAPPPDAPSPVKLADTRPLEKALASAGFKDIRVEPINVRFEFDSPEAFTAQRRAMSMPFRMMLEKQTPELQRKILEAMSNAARKFADSSGKVTMDNQAICVWAHL